MSEQTSSEAPGEPGSTVGHAPAAGMAPEVSRRVGAILDAVEQEAERLREDAHEQAQKYLEEARRRADELLAERRERIAELSDELVAKSEAVLARLEDAEPVRRSFENLVRALGEAADRLAEEAQRADDAAQPPTDNGERSGVPRPSAAPSDDAPSENAPSENAPPETIPTGPDQGARGPAPSQPDNVRTIAIQMAGAGWTRHDVGKHLQQALGVADPEPILGEIFGSNSPDDARVPWTAYPR